VGAGVVAAVVAAGYSATQSKVYEATADVLIQRQASDQVFTNGNSVFDPKRDIQTEVKVLNSSAVQHAAMKQLGHQPDIAITSDDTSNLVAVTASGATPTLAASDANGYAAAYVAYRRQHTVDDLLAAGKQVQDKIDQIDARIAQLPANSSERSADDDQRSYLVQQLARLQVSANLSNAGGADLIAKAQPPGGPAAPKPLRNGLVGGVLGLLMGIALALLLEYLDDGVRERDRLEEALDGHVPLLAEIPLVRAWRKGSSGGLVTAQDPSSPTAEAFRALRTSVLFLSLDREIKSLQITSAAEGEGKTTTAANLAIAIGRAGRKVVVVGGDLRRPRLHEFFGVGNGVGLTSVLLGEATLADALQCPAGEPYVAVLAAGPRPPNPSELLSSPRVRDLMISLADVADIVLVDSPPILPVTDALVISGLVDATILVASAQTSSRRAVRRASLLLEQVGAPLAGTVLNAAKVAPSTYSYGHDLPSPSSPSTNSQPLSRNGKPLTKGYEHATTSEWSS
jgi:capsular exopolysaccharide synthesis family protein